MIVYLETTSDINKKNNKHSLLSSRNLYYQDFEFIY